MQRYQSDHIRISAILFFCFLFGFTGLNTDALAGTPIITNLSDKNLVDDTGAGIYDSDITFTGGGNYVDGYHQRLYLNSM